MEEICTVINFQRIYTKTDGIEKVRYTATTDGYGFYNAHTMGLAYQALKEEMRMRGDIIGDITL